MAELTKMPTMHEAYDTCRIEQKLICKHVRHRHFQLSGNWFNYAPESTRNEINWNISLMQLHHQCSKTSETLYPHY